MLRIKAVRHQRHDAPVRSALDVESTEIDQLVDQIVGASVELESVWQLYSPPAAGSPAFSLRRFTLNARLIRSPTAAVVLGMACV